MSAPALQGDDPTGLFEPAPGAVFSDGLVVICAGNNWDHVKLPDRHMAEALSKRVPVLYVDPPVSHLTRLNDPIAARSIRGPRLRTVAPGITRLTPLVAPKPMHPLMVPITNRIVRRQLRAAVRRLGAQVDTVISTWLFLDVYGACGERVRAYWWTDDPVAAGSLWGRDPSRLAAGDRRLAEDSDIVLAVSEAEVARLRSLGLSAAHLPNGCEAAAYLGVDSAPDPPDVELEKPIAGFVGHLNSRTDLSLLEAIAESGTSLLLIGPRAPDFEPARFEALTARQNVSYLGRRDFSELLPYLKAIDVGVVPYADTDFNRNSFPLKTLEYLAAGLPVVATPLPAVNWLQTDLVTTASTPEDFSAAVLRQAPLADLPDLVSARKELAAEHSWEARSEQLAGLIGLALEPTATEGAVDA